LITATLTPDTWADIERQEQHYREEAAVHEHRQLIEGRLWLALKVLGGILALFVVAIIDYRIWETWPRLPYLGAVAILGVVTMSGTSAFSAQRWLQLGFLPVQPSEIAKILLIVSLAKYFADRESEHQRWYHILLSLVLAASMMPVHKLPDASWPVAMGLGFVSAVFDNIPLTALALKQGGYDWGFVAFAVGFGGSMIWFGSSAGVALSNMYPEAKNAIAWVRGGWHVAVAYVIGFFVMLMVLGWFPQPKHQMSAPIASTIAPFATH